MTKNSDQTSQRMKKLKDERILEEHGQVTKFVGIFNPIEFFIADIDIIN